MPQKQPTKSLLFGQFVFDTWECHASLQSSQFPPSVTVDDDAPPRDHERLSKRQLTLFSKCGQRRGWDGETKTNIARVRAELSRTVGRELAMNAAQLLPGLPW